jgi:hypothetical protein
MNAAIGEDPEAERGLGFEHLEAAHEPEREGERRDEHGDASERQPRGRGHRLRGEDARRQHQEGEVRDTRQELGHGSRSAVPRRRGVRAADAGIAPAGRRRSRGLPVEAHAFARLDLASEQSLQIGARHQTPREGEEALGAAELSLEDLWWRDDLRALEPSHVSQLPERRCSTTSPGT